MNENFAEITKELRNLKNRRKIMKAVLADLEEKIELAEAEIEQQMSSAGIESFVAYGAEYTIKETLSTSIIKEHLPDLINAANANGCGRLVGINSNSLSAYVRNYAKENNGLIPEWIDGYVDLKVRTKLVVKEL